MTALESWLLVDVGNSQIKWLEAGSSDVSSWGSQHSCIRTGEALLASFASAGLSRRAVFLSSVAGQAFNSALAAAFAAAGWPLPQFAVSKPALLGLTNSYAEPSRMGVDRWLAMLAAWSRVASPLIVVDAGTALTIDIVGGDGMHEGGYILPGASLMESALTRDTDRVRFSDGAERTLRPGQSTAQCVTSGIWLATCAAVDKVLSGYPDYAVFVTGGGGRALLELGIRGQWFPNLVLEGLFIDAQSLSKG